MHSGLPKIRTADLGQTPLQEVGRREEFEMSPNIWNRECSTQRTDIDERKGVQISWEEGMGGCVLPPWGVVRPEERVNRGQPSLLHDKWGKREAECCLFVLILLLFILSHNAGTCMCVWVSV